MSMSVIRWGALIVYGLSIVAANWLIRNVGIPIPGGTHLIPVGFGLLAPSGTLAAGITLVARDIVQRTTDRRWGLLVIFPAAALVALLDVRLALASATAFLLSELLEFAVYTPLQKRGLVSAVFASGVAGSVVDSLVFLELAGIPLAIALPGLLLGKLWVQLGAVPVIVMLRQRLPQPAPA